VSSQNLVLVPSFTSMDPLASTSSLIHMRPLQKCESFGFALTWVRVFESTFLFVKRDCHRPSVFSRFTNHLDNKHLFCSCKSRIPNPPWSLGRHNMSHLVSLYLSLLEDPCQKNLDLKKSRFLSTPLGISKKDIINMGRLLKTKFSKTSLPP
jgi:hypothetical protein